MSKCYKTVKAFDMSLFITNDDIVDAASNLAHEMFDDLHLDEEENEELFNDFRYDYLECEIEDAIQDALDSIDMHELFLRWTEQLKEWMED